MSPMKNTLNPFVKAYVEAALWTSLDENEQPLDKNFGPDDIAVETLEQMKSDCAAFRADNEELLEKSGLSLERQGHNFWLSRNGHGAGFFDDNQYKLQRAAKVWGEFNLYAELVEGLACGNSYVIRHNN